MIGLTSLSNVLHILATLLAGHIYKIWRTAKDSVKRDLNPLYGRDYEGKDTEMDKAQPTDQSNKKHFRPSSVDQAYYIDYMENWGQL